MEYTIRKMQQSEYSLLNDFLYNAIFVSQGITPPPKNILNTDKL